MQLNVSIDAEAFLAKLRGTEGRLSQNMHRVVTRLAIEVQGAVKDKLTGGVLHVRTGTLRRSINQKVTQEGASTTAVVGTNVKYAGIHEYGFDGVQSVRAYVRRLSSKPLGKSPNPGTKKALKQSEDVVNVRAHTRHMVMPERSFLRSTLVEYGPRIRSELKAAAMESLR